MAIPQKPARNLDKSPDKKVYRPSFLDRSGDLRPSVERELTNISLAFIDVESELKSLAAKIGSGGGGTAGVSQFGPANNKRSGDVTPMNGDYTIQQITGSQNFVQTNGTNVFTGSNTFNTYPVISATLAAPTQDVQLVSKKYVDDALSNVSIANVAKVDAANVFTLVNTFNELPVSSNVPTSNNQLTNKKYVDDAVKGLNGSVTTALNYIGNISWFNGSSSKIPEGHILANGQELDRTTHAELWAKIEDGTLTSVDETTWQNASGTQYIHRGKYSTGNGTTTFRVPDLNGEQPGSIDGLFLSAYSKGNTSANVPARDVGVVFDQNAPNIKAENPKGGSDYAWRGNSNILDNDTNGAIKIDGIGKYAEGTGGLNGTWFNWSFDASRYNGTYNDGSNWLIPRTVGGVYIIHASNKDVVNGIVPTKAYVDTLFDDNVGISGGYVGSIQWFNGDPNKIPPSYVAASGQLIDRTVEPELWEAVKSGVLNRITDSLWIAGPVGRGNYSLGQKVAGTDNSAANDGDETTGVNFRVPDLNGIQSLSIPAVFLRGSGDAGAQKQIGGVGSVKLSAAPNIYGEFNLHASEQPNIIGGASGAFSGNHLHSGEYRSPIGLGNPSTGADSFGGITFNAQGSDGTYGRVELDSTGAQHPATEIRPNSAVGIWIIQTKQITMKVNAGGFDHIDVGNKDLPITANAVDITGNLKVSGRTTTATATIAGMDIYGDSVNLAIGVPGSPNHNYYFRKDDAVGAFTVAGTESDSGGDKYGPIINSHNTVDDFKAGFRNHHKPGQFSELQMLVTQPTDTWPYGFRSTGDITGPKGTVNWNTSDIRVKKDVKDATGCLDNILKLRPVTFTWNDKLPCEEGKKSQSLVAQEAEKVNPLYVTEHWHSDELPDFKSLELRAIISDLVGAIQELKAEINQLKSAK